MKKLLIVCCLAVLISCSKNDYLDASIGESTVEFAQTTMTETILFIADSQYDIAVPIQIFGGSKAATVRVSAESQLSNDAFSVESTKQIQKDVALDTIHVLVNTDRIKKGTEYSVILRISSDDIRVSQNYATCQIRFSQQAFIDYFTGVYSCFETSTNSTYEVELKKESDTTVRNLNFWDFPLAGQYVSFAFVQNETQAVSIADDTEWTDKLGNKYKISGNGTYDLQGNFSIDFVMKDFATDAVYQSGKQIYTKK